MLIIRSVAELETFVTNERQKGHSIGFVPTMGALHEGHLSLVERAVKENDVTVASVFVNPTQFNNPTDLATYPRDEESDFRLLAHAGVSVAFAPSVKEMYPGGVEGRERHEFSLGMAAVVMEGKYRPGHFQGVAEVVSRLFRLVPRWVGPFEPQCSADSGAAASCTGNPPRACRFCGVCKKPFHPRYT